MTDKRKAARAERGGIESVSRLADSLCRTALFRPVSARVFPLNLIICPLIKTRSRVKRNLQAANSVGGGGAAAPL